MTAHNDVKCPQYNEPALPADDGTCSLCGARMFDQASQSKLVARLCDGDLRAKNQQVADIAAMVSIGDCATLAQEGWHDQQ